MKASRPNPRFRLLTLCAAMLAIHAALKWTLAEHDVVSVLFAAGPHTPLWMLVCAALFVVSRLFVLILLPGLAAWHAVRWVDRNVRERRSAKTPCG